MNPTLGVVGSINQDIVLHATRVPERGETVFGNDIALHPGGKGANQAVALSRLGIPTVMLGCVGSDVFGRDLLHSLTSSGVDTSIIATLPGPSGAALIQIEPRGDNRITVIPGANEALTPELLEREWNQLAQCTMILTQLETPIPTVDALARKCHSAGIPLMLDPAPARPLHADLLQATAWLTPNLSEAQTLLGTAVTPGSLDEAEALAKRLLALGPRNVLLKLGEMGALLARRGESAIVQPAFQIQVEDTTAAGDALNSAFAAALTRGQPIAAALRFACAAAALCVSRRGAQEAMPSLNEVEELLRNA